MKKIKLPKTLRGWAWLLYTVVMTLYIILVILASFDDGKNAVVKKEEQKVEAKAETKKDESKAETKKEEKKEDKNWFVELARETPMWSTRQLKALPPETPVFFYVGMILLIAGIVDWVLRLAGVSQGEGDRD